MESKAKKKDFYKILEIERTSTTAEIKTAYKKLALVLIYLDSFISLLFYIIVMASR